MVSTWSVPTTTNQVSVVDPAFIKRGGGHKIMDACCLIVPKNNGGRWSKIVLHQSNRLEGGGGGGGWLMPFAPFWAELPMDTIISSPKEGRKEHTTHAYLFSLRL